MKQITKKAALRLTRTLWRWLARNPDKNKGAWPGWKKYDDGNVQGHCFCCEYVDQLQARRHLSNVNCPACPLTGYAWTNDCGADSSPYRKWERANSTLVRTRNATRIADACTSALGEL